MRVLVVLCLLVEVVVSAPGAGTSDYLIDLINTRQNQWKAGKNYMKTSLQDLMGVYDINGTYKKMHAELPKKQHDLTNLLLPVNFDPRTHWPKCPSLKEVRDQSTCGSCWAIAAAAAMTDRICIHSNGEKNFNISAQELLTCCENCGKGCYGGDITSAWKFFEEEGIVTGGLYGTNQGCQPYSFKHCDHHITGKYGPCEGNSETPKCEKKCTNPSYNISFDQDKHYGVETYSIEGVENIMAELVTNGPVETLFFLHSDFLLYRSGVYSSTTEIPVGIHAVKIIGYGVENGIDYWLVANSWNEGWGDNGFFKIEKGHDECGIESMLVAGMPLL